MNTNINVILDINNKTNKLYYDLIINDLQNGWIEYLEERTMNEWLNNNEYKCEYEYKYECEYESSDEYDWYNNCWKDWLKLNYYYHLKKPKNIIETIIWENIMNNTEDKRKLKLIIYILLISFGNLLKNNITN